jgi:hypothetical protein
LIATSGDVSQRRAQAVSRALSALNPRQPGTLRLSRDKALLVQSAAFDGFAEPRLIATTQVGGVGETELLQCVCSEAGAVALIADEHDVPVGVIGNRQSKWAGRVEAPLKNVAIDHHGTRQCAVALALPSWADINDESTGCLDGREVGRADAIVGVVHEPTIWRGRAARGHASLRRDSASEVDAKLRSHFVVCGR